MKNVLITGATGLVGGNVLQACLQNEEVGNVVSLLRRPSGITHKKLTEVIVKDFTDYTDLEGNFKDIDIAFFCLAVYAGKVSKEKYREITVDYSESFTSVLKRQSPDATFCLFSAAGADSKEESKMMFARDKGAAENTVLRLQFPQTYIFRPGYIYPVVKRKEPSVTYRIVRRLYPLLKAIYPDGVVTSVHLGKAIFTIGLQGGDQTIFENKEIRKIVTV